MALSVDELRDTVQEMREQGLNNRQISDELSISTSTVEWLQGTSAPEAKPEDVRIGWRTIGVKPNRIDAIGMIMADICDEHLGEDFTTVVGISINGIMFAQSVADQLGREVSIFRVGDDGESGALSNKYGQVGGKRVVIVDDLLNSGDTMRQAIEALHSAGAEVVLCLVLVNKTTKDEIAGIPLRGLIRAVTV